MKRYNSNKITARSLVIKRKYARIGLKNLTKSLKISEKLLITLNEYKKNMSGSVISSNSIGMAVGVSILESILPTVIKENKKLVNKQNKLVK